MNLHCRLKQIESETNMLETQLRHEVEAVSKSEAKLRHRCDDLEHSLGRESGEKDEYLLKIKGLESRIQALESQLSYTEDEKADLEMRLSSLNSVLRRSLGINGNRKSKRIIPLRSSSPMKGGLFDDDTESGYSIDGE